MAGRPDFSQAGSEGSGQHVATVDRPELQSLNEDRITSIASGAAEHVEVYAPAGATYTVNNLALRCAAEGTAVSGTHGFIVYPDVELNSLVGKSLYSSESRFDYGFWVVADDLQRPKTEAGQIEMMQSLTATENSPINIRYNNDTDVAVDNTRKIRLLVKERSY